MNARAIPVQGREFPWTPEAGLEAAVVETVEPWIRRQARALEAVGARRGLDLEDLLQAGRLGALDAARRFDPERENGYLVYAKFLIRRQMLEALGQADEVHQTSREKRQALKDGTLPTVLRLEKPMGEELALADLIPVPALILERTEDAERKTLLARALERLEPQERLLLTLRHGLQGQEALSLEEAGQRLTPPVSREPARQRQKRAESRLRGALRELGLAPIQTGARLRSAPALEPPRPSQAKPAMRLPPPNPGTRRAEREARRTLRTAAQGTPLPLEIPA